MIGIIKEDGGLYYFDNDDHVERQTTMAENSLPLVSNKDVILWPHRLDHTIFHYLKCVFSHLFINKKTQFFYL